MSAETKKIFVTGDIANDYFLVKGERFFTDDENLDHKGTHYVRHNGGASLIFELLDAISAVRKTSVDQVQIVPLFGFKDTVFDILPDKNNGYVSVSKYEEEREIEMEIEKHKQKVKIKVNVARIHELFGFGDLVKEATNLTDYVIPEDKEADILIIDDANMDFASGINKSIWNSVIGTFIKICESRPDSLLIYKKSGLFDKGMLFDEILKASDKSQLNVLTLISISDIRKHDVKVSSGISWEQSAIDLVYELNNNEVLSQLLKCKYLVITFQSSGALFIVNNGGKNEYTLVFDSEKMEGEDEFDDHGKIIGKMSVFTAAFVSYINLARKDKQYKIPDAIKAGLTAVRLFYKLGYKETNGVLNYPFSLIAEELGKTRDFAYSTAPVPDPEALIGRQNLDWSILLDNYSVHKKKPKVEVKALSALAKNIVLKGPGILKNIPSGKFGDLFSIDRSEIESLRNLKKIMETYLKHDAGKKPLSIAVFGPPGAGKSFAVEEIGKGIMGDKYKLITFNLSQFNDNTDLIGALHQVRDSVLKKETPIVFWDEFDSQKFKWLQYLLAPMQDGAFQEGQITHPVGKCIFIFAGGTSYNMSSFGRFRENDKEAEKEFIMKKGPDFISRLNGFIDILGPNKRQLYNSGYVKEEDKWTDDATDLTFPIRRALFITGLLRLKKSDFPFKMDWGLLNAIINVDRYKHGSRSMANLLNDIKQNNPRNMLLRSWLPSKSTLELYFSDADKFYQCLVRETDYLETVWEVAPLIHSYWCDTLKDPSNEYSVDFSFLPVFIKESNVQAASRINEVLRVGGFRITHWNDPAVITEAEYKSIIEEGNPNSLLEKMAVTEHNLWVKFYKDNGWVHNDIRNEYDKKHDCIKPFEKLKEEDKNKDRNLILKYPEILKKIGFGIARV